MSDSRFGRNSRFVREIARRPGAQKINKTSGLNIQGIQVANPGRPQVSIPGGTPGQIPISFEPITMLRAIRPDDLFNGIFRFHNMHRNTFINRAERKEPGRDSYLVLDLPGQCLGEEVLLPSQTANLPLRARIAGRSRLAVRMPQGTASVTLTLEALLDAMGSWPLSLDPLAQSAASSGLNRDMLESVEKTFVGLNLLVWSELAQMGLFSIVHRATSLGAPLVDAAFSLLKSDQPFNRLSVRANLIRSAIETNAVKIANDAVDRYSGDLDEYIVRETAEAQLEIYFALHFSRRLLGSNANVSSARLNRMSGLFDLMMHPHQPGSTTTALEVPYRLITSPPKSTFFQHTNTARTRPYARGKKAELWHTRLRKIAGIFRQDLPPEGVDFFAMWSPDYLTPANPAEPSFDMSLTGEDRRHIVKRTTGHNEETSSGQPYTPVPAKVRELVLSPLGANLDADGNWEYSSAYADFGDLVGWLHQMDYGRDAKVVVTRAGWLYPSGFPASQVEMTERKIKTASNGALTAVLEKRTFIVVNQAVLNFPEQGQNDNGRALPFKRLEAITRVTPNLQKNRKISGLLDTFWLRVNNRPFKMDMAATDDTGRTVRFAQTQIFIRGADIIVANAMTRVANAWNANSPTARAARAADMAGQVVRMVPGAFPETDLPLDQMELRAEPIAGALAQQIENGRRPFHPKVEWVDAVVPGLDAIPGARQRTPRRVSYGQRYLDNALGGARHPVVLEIEDPIDLDFTNDLGSDALGAVGQASQTIRGIATGSGLVPVPQGTSLDGVINGSADWDVVLPDFKVLGRFALQLLLRQLNLPSVQLPTFKTKTAEKDLIREWKLDEPITRTATIGPIALAPLPGDPRIFLHTLAAITVDTFNGYAGIGTQGVGVAVPTNIRDPRIEVHGRVTDVALSLFEIIEVRFREIGFDAISGQKPDARVILDQTDPLIFNGALEFLNGLKDLIPPSGFGDGPRIIPRSDGIEAGFDLALPNLVLGVFSLKNMTLGAATVIPFNDQPVDLRFNFNERHRPFELAVAGFGGGGFFAMVLDTGGIQEIEASLEFGAVASMNIGVASGSVSIKGGVYFRYRVNELILEGYVELRGRMSVLGLISASLLFHMALAYERRGNEKFVRGEATLRIEVEVLFFSTSVTLHVERRFSAGPNDPLLSETTGVADWAEYCEAFA